MSFKIRKTILVANTNADVKILKDNTLNGATTPEFDGFATINASIQIQPSSTLIKQGQIVSLRRTLVGFDSNAIAGANAPNYSVDALGTSFVNFKNETVVPVTNTVRRAAPHTIVATINTVAGLVVGLPYRIRLSYRAIDRNQVDMQRGWKTIGTNDIYTVAMSSINGLAARISLLLNALIKNNPELKTTVSATGSQVNINGGTAGWEFILSLSGDQDSTYQTINATIVTTSPPFVGVNDADYIRTYIQTREGMYNLNNGDTRFLPINGAYYNTYHIVYRVDSGTDEHQMNTINAEQSHLVELVLYVNQAATITNNLLAFLFA